MLGKSLGLRIFACYAAVRSRRSKSEKKWQPYFHYIDNCVNYFAVQFILLCSLNFKLSDKIGISNRNVDCNICHLFHVPHPADQGMELPSEIH